MNIVLSEAVNRHFFNAQLTASIHQGEPRFYAMRIAFLFLHSILDRPAAIAIRDESHMSRQSRRCTCSHVSIVKAWLADDNRRE